MKMLFNFALATLALCAVALSLPARAEQVACPKGATPAACAENQAIHDAFLAGSYMGTNPVFANNVTDPRDYLGSDPDANVRLALRRVNPTSGAVDGKGK